MDRAAFLVVSLALATACATPVAPPGESLPAADPRPAALLSQWIETASARNALRCRAHLALDRDAGDVKLRSKQVLVLERPARLRVEVMGFMNQTAALIATDGARFEVFRAADGSYDAGPVDSTLLWREAGLALAPVEVVDLLLGASAAMGALVPRNAVLADSGQIDMELVDAAGGLRRRVGFGADGSLRELEVIGGGGDVLWRAVFGGYTEVAGAAFAHLIALDLAANSTRVEISLRDVELNPALPADIFRLRGPVATGPPRGEGG